MAKLKSKKILTLSHFGIHLTFELFPSLDICFSCLSYLRAGRPRQVTWY